MGRLPQLDQQYLKGEAPEKLERLSEESAEVVAVAAPGRFIRASEEKVRCPFVHLSQETYQGVIQQTADSPEAAFPPFG